MMLLSLRAETENIPSSEEMEERKIEENFARRGRNLSKHKQNR
jgi:hypothetical protein